MSAIATVAHGAWLAASLTGWQRFRQALQKPELTQKRILRRLLARHKDCSYGRLHGFSEIHTYEDFCAHVPLVAYEDLHPWITRIQKGERQILMVESASRLLPTSGSSGARKLIPFTGGLQSEFNAAIAPWLVDLFRQRPGLINSSAYWSISPKIPDTGLESGAVPIGFEDDSEYLGSFCKKLAEKTFAASSSLRFVEDIEDFRYATLLSLLRRSDLGFISIWHPSFITLLLDSLSKDWDDLLQDIARGGCSRVARCYPQVEKTMHLESLPERARTLRNTGPENLQAIWPFLQVISCWGDGQAALAAEGLRLRFPRSTIQVKGLMATEAIISIPYQGLHPLAITSHFYEFIDASGGVWRGHELQLGQTYEVVVTTAAGLWRYRLGDLVEVNGFCGATPSLTFVARKGQVLDYCGEKLVESFVTTAIRIASANHKMVLSFVMLAPDLSRDKIRCYTLFVEGPVCREFAASIEALLNENPHYQLCCHLGQLGALRCFQIREKAQATFHEVALTSGQRLGEIKPQTLSRRENWAELFNGDYLE